MKRRCYEEVLGLHRFFERWFGTQRQTETDLLRLSGVLAEGFWLRPPGAAVLQRAELIQSVRAQQGAYGRSDPPFRIEIERFHARGYGAETPLFRVTYEEWQTLGGEAQRTRERRLVLQARRYTPRRGLGVPERERALRARKPPQG